MSFSLRLATADDLPFLPPIEVAAGACFADFGMREIVTDPPPSLDELAGYQQDQRAWVVTRDSRPVAYLLAAKIDDGAHIEQVSVHPAWAGNRIGASLITACAEWGHGWGARQTTLTTFTNVPWNAPYYARLGFTIVPPSALTPGLAAIRAVEAARGLDRWPRAVMRRDS